MIYGEPKNAALFDCIDRLEFIRTESYIEERGIFFFFMKRLLVIWEWVAVAKRKGILNFQRQKTHIHTECPSHITQHYMRDCASKFKPICSLPILQL